MTEPPFGRVAIVGAGLIGTSVERASRRAWPAIEATLLDAGDDLSAARGADLVVLAAPVRANMALLEAIQPHVGAGAVVTDTGSTKRTMCAAAARCAMRFIGGHPM